MTGAENPSLTIGVLVAEQPLDAPITDVLESTCSSVTVRSFSTADAAVDQAKAGDIDGLILGDGIESSPTEIRRHASSVKCPVVLLMDRPEEELVTSAAEGEITDLYPQVATEAQCELIIDRIANQRKSDSKGANDSSTRERFSKTENSPFEGQEEQFRLVAENLDEIIFISRGLVSVPQVYEDDSNLELEYMSPRYEEVWGRSIDDLYREPRTFSEAIHPDDEDAYYETLKRWVNDAREGDLDDSYSTEMRIQRPDGEVRWMTATATPVPLADANTYRWIGTIKDVTERHRREQTLETFHEATRELTDSDSKNEACRQAARAAEDVLGFHHVSVHLYDEETGRLEPTATTDRLADLDTEIPAIPPGDSVSWQTYVESKSITSPKHDRDVFGEGISGPDVILPLGSHGVMLVGDPSTSFDEEDIELAQILAATLEAGLNHLTGKRALADRKAELRDQQKRADRLERLNEIIRDIERATVEHSSRAGIEEAVCEHLERHEPNDVVWIAGLQVGNESLNPRVSAGDKGGYVDALSIDTRTGAGSHPAVRAHQRGEPQVVENIATDVTTSEWRKTALSHGIQSTVAVPICHETTTYGILIVESRDPDAFDPQTREVLAELGLSIGYAITIAEREEALESEGTTELEFSVHDDGLFFVRGARTASCDVRLERTVRRTDGSFSTFYAVNGAEPSTLVDLATTAASVQSAQVISTDDDSEGGLIEVAAPTWFGSLFTDHGAVIKEASASPEGGTLLVEAPRGTDVRSLVESFRERYPDVEFVAQRQRERTIRSPFELQDTLESKLTDKQWEALETAYSAGYFAWPRKTSGEGVAELLGITQATFNKHLRFAEQEAIQLLLEQRYPERGA